ncbi:MAG: winged helix-turn-helix transcriptional regulator [Candidatus Hodarchaeota archaeon]
MSFKNKEGDHLLKATSTNRGDVSPSNTFGNEPSMNQLQLKILHLARQLMKKHYVLDTDDLLAACLRYIREDKFKIFRDFNDLIYRKILVNGKAIRRDTLLDNENRASIYELIKRKPGIHFSKIRNTTGKDSRTIQWHLKMLEKFDLIRVENFGRNLVYFDFVLDHDFDLFYYYLQKKSAIDILSIILENPRLSFASLLERSGIPRTTLSEKVKVLIENGFLNTEYQANQLVSISLKDEFIKIFKEFTLTE